MIPQKLTVNAQTLVTSASHKITAKCGILCPKILVLNGETAPRHTFLYSDLQCLPPGDPIILCASVSLRLLENHSFHCSRKLISMVSRSRPLPASRPVSHVIKTHYFLGGHDVEERTVLFRFSTFFINNNRLHQIVWQGAITTT